MSSSKAASKDIANKAEAKASAATAQSSSSSSSSAKAPSLVSTVQKAKAKAAPKSRHVCRRDTEEQAERALKSHFPDWSKEQTHLYEVNGKSMISQVVEDKRALKGSKGKLGPNYWTNLRDTYRVAENGRLRPERAHEQLTINPDLLSALDMARTGNTTERTQRPLINFLDKVEALNPREVVGVANHIMDLRPTVNVCSRQVVLAVMKTFSRLEVKTTQLVVIKRLKAVFDEAMMTCYAEMKKNNVQLEEFWPIYRDQCCLILDESQADRVMAQAGSWMAVAKELQTLTGTSQLGQAMFGEFHECVVSERVHIALRRSVSMMQKEPKLDKLVMAKCAHDFEEEVKGTEARKLLLKKRHAEVVYRGLTLQIQVTSIDEEMSLARAAWVKTHAIPEHLDELRYEKNILDADGARTAKKEISEDLLAEYASARVAAAAMIEPCEGGIQILDKLQSKISLLTAIDSTFVIEVAACAALVGKSGLQMVQNRLLHILPSEERQLSLEEAVREVQQLQTSSLYAVVNSDGKGLTDAVCSLLTKMSTGQGPSRALLANSDFMVQVQEDETRRDRLGV